MLYSENTLIFTAKGQRGRYKGTHPDLYWEALRVG